MRKRNALIVALAIMVIGCPEEGGSGHPVLPPHSPLPGDRAQPTPPPQPVSQPAQPPPPPPATTVGVGGDVAAGKRLYLTACANCHGPDGTGSMMRQALPKIGDLTSPEVHGRMSDQDIATLVQNGRDKMPAFGTMFGPEQMSAMIAYVRTLKKSP